MKRYLGLDPGLSGAIAVLTVHDNKDAETWFSPFPTIENEIDFVTLRKLFSTFGDCFAVLERVHSMPKQGISSAFRFGRVFASLQTCLHIFQIEHIEVTPQKWQKEFHEGIAKDLDPKARSLIAVQRLFPHANLLATERSKKPHDGYVDALLLAEYGRRKTFSLMTQNLVVIK